MKPIALRGLTEEKRVFNYRLSRARPISENCSNSFRMYSTVAIVVPDDAVKIILATFAIHNLRAKISSRCIPKGYVHYEDDVGVIK